MKKLAIAAVAMGVILFYGCTFLLWGAWIFLSGFGTRPAGLEYLMMGFGVSIIIVGTIIVYVTLRTTPAKNA